MIPVPHPSDVGTIAIRLTNWVGDVVMNTPFLAATRRLFPRARIIAMGRASVAGVLANHPHVNEVWTIDDRTRSGYMAAVRKLRYAVPDLGFALPNSLNSAMMLRMGKARHRVGYDRDGRGMLLTHPIKLRPQDLAVHEVKYYLRLLSPWKANPMEPPPLCLAVTNEEKARFTEWLVARKIDEHHPLIGINPAAFYGTAKRWLPERYAEAGRQLADGIGARVVVTGLPKERDVAQKVCDAGGQEFYNAAGEMTLRELLAFLQRARLFLTNDSGAMHIAAALGTPLVAVFGSTDWVTTAPLSPRSTIVRTETECAPCLLRDCPIDHRCMTRVSADQVIEAGSKLLNPADL